MFQLFYDAVNKTYDFYPNGRLNALDVALKEIREAQSDMRQGTLEFFIEELLLTCFDEDALKCDVEATDPINAQEKKIHEFNVNKISYLIGKIIDEASVRYKIELGKEFINSSISDLRNFVPFFDW